MLHIVCNLVFVLHLAICSQLTSYNDGRYSPSVETPDGSYIELNMCGEAPHYSKSSYQNDEYITEKLEKTLETVPDHSKFNNFIRKGKIAAGSISCILILSFMLHIHDICWDPKMKLPLFLFGMLTLFPIAFEFSLFLIELAELYHLGCPNKERGAMNILLSSASAGLHIMRISAATTPFESNGIVTDELCTWKGDTLFTSLKWTTLVFLPSIILVLISLVELAMEYMCNSCISEGQRKNSQ